MRVNRINGFTLIEIIIVLVIIGILAAIAIPSFQNYQVGIKSEGQSAAISDESFAIVRAFFATDRNIQDQSSLNKRFGDERDSLKFGSIDISIPRDHRMGELESPSFLRFEFREDPNKHVVILSITDRTEDAFYFDISEKLNTSNEESALVFIHGYNTSFEEAAKRTAQMTYDLAFRGAPVFYSWPSQAKLASYTVDEQNIEWSQPNIEKFLVNFFEHSKANKVFLIAHSMGNRGLTKALKSLFEKRPDVRARIAEIILAAPDVDAEVFKRDIIPNLISAGAPVTLYASSGDLALQASKKVHGFPRAGESGEQLVIVEGLETIDASNVRSDFVGHTYFAESTSILSDIFNIIHHNQRADERFGLSPIETPQGRYWEFKP